jgi:hypothetical protein
MQEIVISLVAAVACKFRQSWVEATNDFGLEQNDPAPARVITT